MVTITWEGQNHSVRRAHRSSDSFPQTVSDLNEEISKRILEYLAKMKKEFPDKPNVYRKTMLKDLRLDDATLDFYVKLLSEKYLVYIQTPMPYSPWTHANITASGAIQVEE